jgi:hypothetical protein
MSWRDLSPAVRIRYQRLLQLIHESEVAGVIPRELLLACHHDAGSVEAIDPDEELDPDEYCVVCPACQSPATVLRYGVIEVGSVRCAECGWWGHESEVRRVHE